MPAPDAFSELRRLALLATAKEQEIARQERSSSPDAELIRKLREDREKLAERSRAITKRLNGGGT
jgi:hypothetical protein